MSFLAVKKFEYSDGDGEIRVLVKFVVIRMFVKTSNERLINWLYLVLRY